MPETGASPGWQGLDTLLTWIVFGGRPRHVYRRMVTRSGTGPGDRVLDLGGSSYLARQLTAAASPVGSVTVARPPDLADFPDVSFDGVTCVLSLHRVPEASRQHTLAELYRVTRPGGRLLVADFNVSRRVAPLDELAVSAGYEVQDRWFLPLMRYIFALRP